MGKLRLASPDVEKLIQDVAQEMGLIQQGLEFQALCTTKAKEIVKVSKAGEVAEVMSDKENLLVVIVYEDAFDVVDEKTRFMWTRMALDSVVYDSEKNKVTLSAPMLTMTLGCYQKFGNVATQHAELALHTIQQLEEAEKQRKAEAKAAKTRKRKRF
jgi:outer membrane murein-binding lipoprotein Lpp